MIERTYKGCCPMPSITAPNIRDDGHKNLSDNYPRLTSIEKELKEKQNAPTLQTLHMS